MHGAPPERVPGIDARRAFLVRGELPDASCVQKLRKKAEFLCFDHISGHRNEAHFPGT